jgi:urease gamma subunit
MPPKKALKNYEKGEKMSNLMIDKIIFKFDLFEDEEVVLFFLSRFAGTFKETYPSEYKNLITIMKRIMFKEGKHQEDLGTYRHEVIKHDDLMEEIRRMMQTVE